VSLTGMDRQGGGVTPQPVPRMVHQIWLQGGPLPPPLDTYQAGVRDICTRASWAYRLWWETDVASLSESARATWLCFRSLCRTPAQSSDVLRYLILHEYGGLYLDTDAELFRLPEGLSGAWVVGTAPEHVPLSCQRACVNDCCMAAPPGHPFLARLLAGLGSARYDRINGLGPQHCGAHAGSDVSIWPAPMWQGGAKSYGYHHSLGNRDLTYRPYSFQ
jgi:mannosyltransferase OCH1-like enzyme